MRHRLRHLARERAGLGRRSARATNQVQRLGRAATSVDAEIWRIRPIGLCPVRGPHTVSDDFGAPRWVEGKVHVHLGNDILAPYGTPIVAPFDGRAVAAPNTLGGMAVKVYGASGYAYNAHLSRYGRLGPVSAGTVVGYVGSSGDARGGPAHDHFEWHPGDGPAVDPHPSLMMVC
jgi:murein DD-endopeptidase MepM/ murein hydrolase activator NlpD